MAWLHLLRPAALAPAADWSYARFSVPRRLARALEASPAALPHVAALLSFGTAPELGPLHPSARGVDLALALLAPRVSAVYQVGAAPWPDDDHEHVHALRVATRRLREALEVAAPLLPAKALRRASRRARALGRTLGVRRTLDVLLRDLADHYAARGLPPDFAPSFAAYLRARRDEATVHVKEALPPARLERHGLRVLELALRAFDAPTLGALAGPHLEARLAEVSPLLPVIEEPNEVERHHELRIALKHLRYATEILGAVWPAQLPAEDTVVPLKRLQDALGDLNDAQELLALAREHRTDVVYDGPALDALIADLGELGLTRYEAARAVVRELGPALVERLGAASGSFTR